MSIFWFTLTTEQAAFWGGIIGSIIGVLGAFGAALFAALWTRRGDALKAETQRAKEHKDQEDEKIATYNRSIARAEAVLQGYLSQMIADVRYLQKGIAHSPVEGVMVNLPRPIDFDAELMFSLKNQELVNKWLRLSIRVRQVNNLIDDYRTLYTRSSESIRDLQLSKQPYEEKIVSEDYAAIKGFGSAVISGIELLVDDTMGLFALVEHHAKFEDDKFTSIQDVNKYKIELMDYETELDDIKTRFDPNNLFQNLN